MTHLPEITGSKLIRILKKDGWTIKSQKGSHVKLVKKNVMHFIIVPVHAKGTIPKGTLANIIKDAGLTIEKFIKMI